MRGLRAGRDSRKATSAIADRALLRCPRCGFVVAVELAVGRVAHRSLAVPAGAQVVAQTRESALSVSGATVRSSESALESA